MSLPEVFTGYLDTAAAQVRWKRARPALTAELRTHLLDQYDACLGDGLDETAAAAEALRQTGDAVEIGTALDRAHRPRPQWGLLALTGVLAGMGLVLQFLIRNDTLYRGREMYSFAGQLTGTLLGLACMLGLYFLDYTALGKRPWLCYFSLLGVVCFCFYERVLPFLLPVLYSLERYAFYLLFFAPVAYGLAIYQLRGKGTRGVFLALGAMFPFLLAAALLGRLGQASILLLVGLVLLLLAIAKGWFGGKRSAHLCCALLPPLGLVTYLVLRNQDWLSRHLALALHPELDPLGAGFLPLTIQRYLQGAKLVGTGAPAEDPAFSSVLHAYAGTDLFLTWTIHKLGALAGVAVMLLLVALLLWGFLVCRRQQNMLGRLLGTAVLLVLSVQTALYLAANLGFVVVGSLSLPLLSYGKAYQVVNLALLGLLFSVFRGERLPVCFPSSKESAGKWPSRIRWQDGELVISFRPAARVAPGPAHHFE